jgi:pimeloyl-ACP methyl ester carboxylesterase
MGGDRISRPREDRPTDAVVAVDKDSVVEFLADAYHPLEANAPNLTRKVLLPGAGHWNEERPAEVNRLLIEFLRSVGRRET